MSARKSSAKQLTQHFHAFGADDQRGKSAFFIRKIKIFDKEYDFHHANTEKLIWVYAKTIFEAAEKKSDGKYECVDHE